MITTYMTIIMCNNRWEVALSGIQFVNIEKHILQGLLYLYELQCLILTTHSFSDFQDELKDINTRLIHCCDFTHSY